MAYDINWALLGRPADIPGAISAGYERGRDMRLRGQQESAFAMLARDPNSAEGRALLVESGRPDLARQFRQWGKEDRREELWRSALGGGAAPGAPTTAPASAFAPAGPPTASLTPLGAPPAAVPAAPVSAQPASPFGAPAASRAPGQLNPDLMRQFFAEDPEGARELMTAWNQLNNLQRAEQTRRFTAAVPILAEVARLPQAERGRAIMAQAQFLVSNGWQPEQIQAFASDPNDQTIRMLLRMGVPIAEQREFFAPIEGGSGEVLRDPVSLRVLSANPSPPRSETYYDANGQEFIRTVPGTPALGPDAERFGPTQHADLATSAGPPEVGSVRTGPDGRNYRFKGGDWRDRNNWEVSEGGPSPRGSATFPAP